jgi:hypothetical protein
MGDMKFLQASRRYEESGGFGRPKSLEVVLRVLTIFSRGGQEG